MAVRLVAILMYWLMSAAHHVDVPCTMYCLELTLVAFFVNGDDVWHQTWH